MSLTTKFGFTNTTDTTNKITLKALALASDYGKTTNVATKCVLNNVTSPADAPEIIEFTGSRIKNVDIPQPNYYPPKVAEGVVYGVRVAELATVSSSEDAAFRIDLPIEVRIEMRHSNNGSISESMVEQILIRALSCFYKADGTTRIPELMRGALAPDED